MKSIAIKVNWQYISLLVLAATLIIAYCFLDPFSDLLVSNTVAITPLTAAQRSNIELASKRLDGIILMPGQTFSFNKIIGSRSAREGYSKSPSYLEGDSPLTFGGGICLLSSVLYKSVLELGLPINERCAHTRTTQCIPPGFDATVWYGQSDLKFTNAQKSPIKIETKLDNQNLTINVYGDQDRDQSKNVTLQRIVNRIDKDTILVSVFRQENARLNLISKDLYRISRHSFDIAQNKANHYKSNNRI